MPRRVRPKVPEESYLPDDPGHWVARAQTSEKLVKGEVYLVSTSSGDGEPRATHAWFAPKMHRMLVNFVF